MPYVKPNIARKELGVSNDTLRTWASTGQLKTITAESGHRLYDISSFTKDKEFEPIQYGKKYIYCRVSSGKQKADLGRQIDYLKSQYPTHEVISETASGINFKRKMLNKIMDEAIKGMVSEVVVAHRDRLCRIAWKHFEWLFERLGVNLIVHNKSEYSPEQELQEDLLSIIHVFSCRHYGARRKYTKKSNEDGISTEDDKTNQPTTCEECKEES